MNPGEFFEWFLESLPEDRNQLVLSRRRKPMLLQPHLMLAQAGVAPCCKYIVLSEFKIQKF